MNAKTNQSARRAVTRIESHPSTLRQAQGTAGSGQVKYRLPPA
ncbi:MAG: hypothetical protein ACPGWR_29095 [Ardenticatenaceae bacterium]